MENCIFCKIVRGEIPATKIYEDDEIVAFLDITPVNPGHTLVVPKEHYPGLFEMPDELLGTIASKTKELGWSIKNAVGADGMNIMQNNDAAAGQIIFHYHVHLIPRFISDDYKHWHGKPYATGEIEKIAEKIKSALR